jgi:hypothetical protein
MNPRLAALLAAHGISIRFDTDDAALDALADHLRARQDRADAVDRTRTEALATAVRERDEARAVLATTATDRDAQKARADAADAERTRLQTEAKTRADADEAAALEPLCKRHRVDLKADLPAKKRAIAAAHLGRELRQDEDDAFVGALVALAREDLAKGRAAGRATTTPAARADAAPPKRRLTANEQHAANVAAARKAQGIG